MTELDKYKSYLEMLGWEIRIDNLSINKVRYYSYVKNNEIFRYISIDNKILQIGDNINYYEFEIIDRENGLAKEKFTKSDFNNRYLSTIREFKLQLLYDERGI